MISIDLGLDVTPASGRVGSCEVAATAFLPDGGAPIRPVCVFAVPGGGYSRHYFDMRFAGHEGYSQAEHLTAAGYTVIAIDPVGVGDSTVGDPGAITIEILADTYAWAVRDLARRLRDGTLAPNLPAQPELRTIGIGQSMGGCVTVAAQGRHKLFSGIAPLGYSVIHTVLPQPTEAARQAGIAAFAHGRETDPATLRIGQPVSDFRYPFHWEDVPEEIVKEDMAGGYPIRLTSPRYGSRTIPICAVQMMMPGCVAAEAANVDVPVFIGAGERDTLAEPQREPSAFPRSRDITLFIAPRMAHMHNFASTRAVLWNRLRAWMEALV